MENDLQYCIKGIKIDANEIILKKNNLLWRTDKNQDEILLIMREIQHKVQQLIINLNLSSETLYRFNDPFESKQYNVKSFSSSKNISSKTIKNVKVDSKKYYTSNVDRLLIMSLMSRKMFFLPQVLSRRNKSMSNKLHTFFYKKSTSSPTSHNNKKLPLITCNVNIFLCENKNWVDDYKRSIQPVVCGNFYIRPSWHQEDKQYNNLVIDPSLSFGSGHHATTAMCIRLLSDVFMKNLNVLDVGCGSGILSLVCAKMGAKIYACDTDEYACEQSKMNFDKNNLNYVSIWQGSINSLADYKDIPQKYHCICANIVGSVILLLKNSFVEHLEHNGILVISGILQEYENKILENFSCLKLLEKVQIDEWLAFKFIKK